MSSKTLINIDELISKLKDESIPEIIERKEVDDVDLFFIQYGIKPGSKPLSTQVLYLLYTKWGRGEKLKLKFYSAVKKRLPHTSATVLIDEKSILITDENLQTLEQVENGVYIAPILEHRFRLFLKEFELFRSANNRNTILLTFLLDKFKQHHNKTTQKEFVMLFEKYGFTVSKSKLGYITQVTDSFYNHISKEEVVAHYERQREKAHQKIPRKIRSSKS